MCPARRSSWIVRAAASCGTLAVLVAGCSAPGPAPAPTPSTPSTASAEQVEKSPSRLFGGGDNVFTQDISGAPVAPDSAAMVAKLTRQVTDHYNGVAALNSYQYNASMYVVDGSTPRVDVRFDDCQKKGYTPQGLLDGPRQFESVPIPADAQPAVGTDKALSIVSPSTDQVWEFWVTHKDARGWSACWGGRIDHASANVGRFAHPYGATASGLPMVGSMVTLAEARALRIDHAVSLVLIDNAAQDTFSYPANRSDGRDSSAHAIPIGSRIRLPRSIDVDSLGLSPLGAAIARAAQTYGFIVVDTSGAVAVITQSGQEEQARTGVDPWPVILKGVEPYNVMAGFPWDKVEIIEKDYGAPGGAAGSTS